MPPNDREPAIATYRAERKSLTQQVSELLQRYIVDHRLQPGDPLPSELELASLFGVSRAIVREGLSAVATLGIVDNAAGKRPRVRGPSGQALGAFFAAAVHYDGRFLTELLELREALEVYAAQHAARDPSDEDLAQLERLAATMAATIFDDDKRSFVRADVEFHGLLVRMSGNVMLGFVIDGLREAMEETITQGLHSRTTDDELRRINVAHQEVVDALRARDPERSAEAMRLHFQDPIRALLHRAGS